MRRLIIVILASSTFGGVIGALATAATQSQASPSAVASAVLKVQDTKAEQDLSLLDRSLNGTFKSPIGVIADDLYEICLNTGPTNNSCQLPAEPVVSGFQRHLRVAAKRAGPSARTR
jgi:hypothetical protein